MMMRDRMFLARSQQVAENLERRSKILAETVLTAALSTESANAGRFLELIEKLETLQAEREAHTARLNALLEMQQTERDIINLCADANKLAGTDGANFFTKAGKVFTGETPHDKTDDRTGK